MIVITDEIENKTLRELILQEADVILVYKGNNEYWIAKNRFGKQKQLYDYEVPVFVKSYLSLKNP